MIVNIDWTPRLAAITYLIDGVVYPPVTQEDAIPRASDIRYVEYGSPINIPLLFTSTVLPAGDEVTEYRWNMGDGTVKFGSSVTHSYKTAVPERRVSLSVQNTKGERASVSRLLHLRYTDRVQVAGGQIRP
jgi:hypothetical protein